MSRTELPEGMAVGFRFHPTDEELIRSYLKPKLLGKGSEVDHIIAEVDYCKLEPWDLPSKSKIGSKDGMWLFFCVQTLKFEKNKSSKKKTKSAGIWKIAGKKTTGTGFWKITGEERTIKDEDTKECIGKKRTLVFYKGPYPGKKTNWVMQLYYIIPDHPFPNQRTYALCRLKKKSNDIANTPDPEKGANVAANTLDPAQGANDMAYGDEQVYEQLRSQPLCSPRSDDQYPMQAFSGDVEEEESPEEILNRLLADPDSMGMYVLGKAQMEAPMPSSRWDGLIPESGSGTCSSPVGSNFVHYMHLEVGYIPQADFGSEEETVLSPHDQFAEEDASSLDVTLGQQATVSFTERPPNEYPSSTRSKRTNEAGYWKITGKERAIKGGDGKTCIGMKKNLVFYEGSSPGKKTNWVMQEYYIETDKALPHQSGSGTCGSPVGSNDVDYMHLEVGYIPQADFGSEEETVLSPPDQFAEEDASSLDVTLGQQATVSFTERPPNEVEEEAETLNSIPVPAPESCSFLLLVIAIFFAVAFAAMFGVLVFSTYKRVLEFSRKRRSFVLLFCSVAFIHLGVQEFAWRFGSLHHGTALNPAA